MRHIRPAVTEDMAKSVACALVGARLDYANSVLFGVTSKNVTRLQRAQNAAARVFVWGSNRRSTNFSNILEQLHCTLNGVVGTAVHNLLMQATCNKVV